jgi:hypothetical protein
LPSTVGPNSSTAIFAASTEPGPLLSPATPIEIVGVLETFWKLPPVKPPAQIKLRERWCVLSLQDRGLWLRDRWIAVRAPDGERNRVESVPRYTLAPAGLLASLTVPMGLGSRVAGKTHQRGGQGRQGGSQTSGLCGARHDYPHRVTPAISAAYCLLELANRPFPTVISDLVQQAR